MKLSDGIYDRRQVPRDEYDRIARLNWSHTKHLGRSGEHFRHHLMQPPRDTDPMRLGRVTSLATFEPERFRAEVAVYEGKVRRGKEWEAFKDSFPDSEIVTKDQHETSLAIGQKVRADVEARKWLTGGKGEQTVLWTYRVPEVGALPGYSIECKSRLDFIKTDAIVDLKTTASAAPGPFGKQCWNLEYHAQAAFYVDAVKAVTGVELPYVLVAVEVAAPYVVQVYTVPHEILELGRERYRNLLGTWRAYDAESRWPGYAEGPLELTLPKWAVPFEDEEANDLGITFGGQPAVGF